MRLRLLGVLLLQTVVSAVGQVRPTTFLLEETTIVAGTAGQFEPAQQSYCGAAVKAGAPFCLVYSSAIFGEANHYLTFLPFSGFGHFDQGKYAADGLTIEEEHALTGPPAAQTRQSAVMVEPELSFSHMTNNNRPLNLIVEYQLRPGALSDFLGLIRSTVLPMARKSGAPAFEVFHTLVGAGQERVFVVTRLDSFAQLDHLPFAPDSSAWQEFQSRNVVASSSSVVRYRPEISANPVDPTP